MEDMKNNVVAFFSTTVEYIGISILLASTVMILGSKNTKSRLYFIAAVLLGAVSGFVADHTPLLKDYSYIAAMFGTLIGPSTVARLQGEDLLSLYEKLSPVQRLTKRKEKDE